MSKHASESSKSPPYQKEIDNLREENQILQGKIRGYLTLGDLYREQIESYRKLELEKETLVTEVTKLQMALQSNKSTTGTMEQEALDHSSVPVSPVGVPCDPKPINFPLQSTDQTADYQADILSKRTEDVFSKNEFNPSDEKFPMQESLEVVPVDTKKNSKSTRESQCSSSIENIDNSERSLGSVNIFGDNAGCDGTPLQQQISTKASFGSSSKHDNSLNLIEFTSVKSEHSKSSSGLQEIHLPPDYEHTSCQISQSTDDSDRALSVKVSEAAVALDLATDGPAEKLKKFLDEMVPEITRQEEETFRYKSENKKLSQQIDKMKEENKLMLSKIKRLESQVNDVTPIPSMSSQGEWEHIQRNDIQRLEASTTTMTLSEDMGRKLADLECQNMKLKEANSKWQELFANRSIGNRNENENLKHENERLKDYIASFEKKDEKRQQEFDKILLTAKQQQNQAEAGKEDLQRQLEVTTVRMEAIEAHCRELEEKCQRLQREKQAIQVEIDVIKGGNARLPDSSLNRTDQELRTENAVLREQLTVFQEDFDRERGDRAHAQAAKDDLHKRLESEKQEVGRLKAEVQRLKQQFKIAERNLQQSYRKNHDVQLENQNLKTQLKQERENNARSNNMYTPYHQGFQTAGYHSTQGGQLRTHPETDPYCGPVPPHMFQNGRQSGMNGYNQEISNRHAVPPEQLPGSWNCHSCTYCNHPRRTVCEMCGHHYTGPYSHSQNLSQPLMPRGDFNVNLDESNDLCTDSVKVAVVNGE